MSFDRATEYYDATRGLPAEIREAVAAVVAAEVAGRQPCLEIGIGTGRIALPLQQRGVSLLGVDLSAAMLGRLIANAGGDRPFPLLVGDASNLALRSGSVGAVLASHVLHLVPDWRQAVDEALLVLQPEGVLLVDFGGGAPAPWGKPAEAILQRHGVYHIRPGVSDAQEVAGYLGGRAEIRALDPVPMTLLRSLARDLDEWEGQTHAWTWPYSHEQMAAACREVRLWAADEGRSLEEEVELTRLIQWWAYDLTA